TGAKKTVDGALTSLDDVSKTASTDPRPAYQAFSRGVEQIESSAETARARSIAIKTRAKEHHDKWLEELAGIQSEDVRKSAEERRQKALASFQALDAQMAEVKTAYEPFIGLLKDIRVYLMNDLSPGGIASIKGQARQASERGREVEGKIDKLVAEIAKVRNEIEITKPTAQPAAGYR
ncbi:MAG: DUF2959 family protein, partial [Planctomycetota bacterium]